MQLTDKYRPRTIADFLAIEKPKKLCSKLVSQPHECALIFKGDSGMGKTTLALALAEQIPAEIHHIASQDCTVAEIDRVHRSCQYVPMAGKRMHVVIVDEADQMSNAAQLSLLSKLDATNATPNTIWIFTCNETERFADRFLSRCVMVEFSNYGVAKEATQLLADVWEKESNGATAPNFARIVKEANNNIRTALNKLQHELMMA
jgi:replication-associated recombination protein RarA